VIPPSAEAVRTGQPVWLESAEEMRVRFPEFTLHLIARGHESAAALPLTIDGRVIGALGLMFQGPRRFGGDAREFMLAVAGDRSMSVKTFAEGLVAGLWQGIEPARKSR